MFLSQFDDEKASKFIEEHGLPHFTSKSIVDKDQYLAELKNVRDQGYALDNEEYMEGVKAVAVALGNHRGLPLAIWVVGFSSSMSNEKLPNITKQTLETSKQIRSALENPR